MSVPGVNVICAASFLAAIGDDRPVQEPAQARRLPRSGPQGPPVRARARHARAHLQAGLRVGTLGAGRGVLERGAPARADARVLSAHPRPPRPPVAVVAAARKLACLFWCLLTREEDYAYAAAVADQEEAAAPGDRRRRAERTRPGRTASGRANHAMREAERELAEQAELAYATPSATGTPAQARTKVGASVTPGRASNRPSKGKAARQTTSP